MSGASQHKQQRRRRLSRGAAVCLLVVVATACGGGGGGQQAATSSASSSATVAPATTSTTTGAPAPASAQITIEGFQYTDHVTVAPGGQVSVVNKDSAEHTVTSNTAGLFDVDVKGTGQSTFAAPAQPGSYPYHCTFHPSMHGVLVVQ
jgi:plastocyanin